MVSMEPTAMGSATEWHLSMWKIRGKYGEYPRHVGWIMLVPDTVYLRFHKHAFDDDHIHLLWESNAKSRWRMSQGPNHCPRVSVGIMDFLNYFSVATKSLPCCP